MIRAYKYRIYPNKNQIDFLEKSFGCTRYIYNWALDLRIKAYQENKETLSAIDLCKRLTVLKKDEDKQWLSEPTNECLQQSIRNMDSAFTRFFREKKGFPKFKSKHKNKNSCKFINSVSFDFENKRIKVPKCGLVKFSCDRIFNGKIGTLTISKSPTNKYYASVLVDDKEPMPDKPKIKEETTIGIDVGIKSFAVLSNGKVFENMKFLEKNEKRLAVIQKRFSRKQKGSNRRKSYKLKVARQYERITNLRTNYIHQVTSKIIAENQSIVIEDLNIDGMLKNHCLAKSISSVAWGEFFRQLEYKSEFYGRNLVRIGRFEPSSKLCECGTINNELKLSDRIWTCKACGRVNNRDELASKNIKKFGLKRQNLIGLTPAVSGAEDVELSAVVGAKKRQYM